MWLAVGRLETEGTLVCVVFLCLGGLQDPEQRPTAAEVLLMPVLCEKR